MTAREYSEFFQFTQRNPRVKFIREATPFYKCTFSFIITENHLIDSKYFLVWFFVILVHKSFPSQFPLASRLTGK